MSKTIAIIQARCASTRFPLKIVAPLLHRPMLEHIVERVSRAKLLDGVVLAMPKTNADMIVAGKVVCKAYHWDIDENDLIRRLYHTATAEKATFIVRVCADCPCVEPEEIDHLVKNISAYGDWRLLMNSENPRESHDGFGGELYTIEMLECMDRALKEPIYREHPHEFWVFLNLFDYCGKPYRQGFRLDVNTPADYERIKDIYDHFGHNHFTVKEVIEYLDQKKDC